MKIKTFYLKPQTQISIEEFADFHNLTMEIHERTKEFWPDRRYYAHFEGVEVSDGCLLAGVYGDGSSPEKAVEAYAKELSGETIKVREKVRHVEVPKLTYNCKTCL